MNTIQKQTSFSVIGGLVLIALGALFLFNNLLGLNLLAAVGPLLVTAFGLMFFIGMFAEGKSAGGLAIPGSMFVILGLILFAQTLLDYWASWAYAWSLFALTGVGVGLVINSWWSDKPNLKRPGYTLIVLGLVFFLVFGVFFETLFGLFGSGMLAGVWLPIVLITLGAGLLFGRLFNWSQFIEWLPPHNEIKSSDAESSLVKVVSVEEK